MDAVACLHLVQVIAYCPLLDTEPNQAALTASDMIDQLLKNNNCPIMLKSLNSQASNLPPNNYLDQLSDLFQKTLTNYATAIFPLQVKLSVL